MGLVGETSVAFGAVALGLGMADSVTGPEATAVAAAVAATEVLVTSVAGGCGEGDGVAGAACVGVPPDCASRFAAAWPLAVAFACVCVCVHVCMCMCIFIVHVHAHVMPERCPPRGQLGSQAWQTTAWPGYIGLQPECIAF